MPASQRKFKPALIAQLFTDPYRFDFFQAVYLLEKFIGDGKAGDDEIISQYIRFENSLSLNFPASEIEEIVLGSVDHDEGSVDHSTHVHELRAGTIKLRQSLYGMLGLTGTLPAHYTERIAAYVASAKDDGPRAFIDTFSNRAVALFFESERKYRPELQRQQSKKDALLDQLLSLAGMPKKRVGSSPIDNCIIESETLAYYVSAIRQKPISSPYLNQILEEYFSVPITVTSFEGAWYVLSADQQCALGSANAALGVSAMAGTRVWQRHLRQKIEIGPIGRAAYEGFLPNGDSAIVLRQLLETFTGLSTEYEVELILESSAINAPILKSFDSAIRLGQNTFLKTIPDARHRRDVRYEILAF